MSAEAVVASRRSRPFVWLPRRLRPPVVIGIAMFFLGSLVVMAVFGSAITPYDPTALDFHTVLAGPNAQHWVGTDELGRDVFSRLIVGSRTALIGPLIVAIGSAVIGNLLGLWSGYRGGMVDTMIMRWVDLMFAIPALLVIIVVAGVIGGGYWTAVMLILILTVPYDARVVRGATLEQAPRPYVEAAKTLGVSDWRIMVQHIWPNVAAVSVAQMCLIFAGSLLALAGLSYLGLGVPPGTPDWGLMESDGRTLLFDNPLGTLAPGVMIVVTAASVNVIGDWLYERISSRGATR